MRKTLIKTLIVLAVAGTILSCGKDDDKVTYPTEKPLQAYLTAAGFTEISNNIDDGDYEFGITFKPTVNGQISAIVMKIPDNAENVRVTIWDAETKTILRTETVPTVVADTEVTTTITALALSKDHEYMITYNGNDWYNHTKPDNSAVTYPFTVGHVTVTGYAYVDGTDQIFPTDLQYDYYAGDLDFVFQQTN